MHYGKLCVVRGHSQRQNIYDFFCFLNSKWLYINIDFLLSIYFQNKVCFNSNFMIQVSHNVNISLAKEYKKFHPKYEHNHKYLSICIYRSISNQTNIANSKSPFESFTRKKKQNTFRGYNADISLAKSSYNITTYHTIIL